MFGLGTFVQRQKRRLAALLAFLLALQGPLMAASTAPTPGDAVLIIYVNNAYGTTMIANVQTALNAIPVAQRPTVTTLAIPLGDMNGIYDNLTGAGLSLANFCQVWDMRFMDTNNLCCSGTIREDSITQTGANNDALLFQSFLANGGHLYIQGDNEGFYARNEGVTQFLGTATGATVGYPAVVVGTKSWTSIDNTAPDNFASNYGALASVGTDYAGQVPLAQVGGGKVLIKDASYALEVLYDAPLLTAGNGKLMVNYDTNTFYNNLTGMTALVQNNYVTMSTCYNFTVTKAVAPAQVCAGDPAVFTVCYQNTGTRAVPSAVVWDTLPACTTFTSSTPAPTGNSGQLYWWSLGTVNPGPQICVTINVVTSTCP